MLVSIPGKSKGFLFPRTCRPALELTWFTIRWVLRVISREQNGYSPPSSAEVKNEWRDTSVPLIRLHDMDGDDFAFTARRSLSGLPPRTSQISCQEVHF